MSATTTPVWSPGTEPTHDSEGSRVCTTTSQSRGGRPSPTETGPGRGLRVRGRREVENREGPPRLSAGEGQDGRGLGEARQRRPASHVVGGTYGVTGLGRGPYREPGAPGDSCPLRDAPRPRTVLGTDRRGPPFSGIPSSGSHLASTPRRSPSSSAAASAGPASPSSRGAAAPRASRPEPSAAAAVEKGSALASRRLSPQGLASTAVLETRPPTPPGRESWG